MRQFLQPSTSLWYWSAVLCALLPAFSCEVFDGFLPYTSCSPLGISMRLRAGLWLSPWRSIFWMPFSWNIIEKSQSVKRIGFVCVGYIRLQISQRCSIFRSCNNEMKDSRDIYRNKQDSYSHHYTQKVTAMFLIWIRISNTTSTRNLQDT